MLYMHTQQDSPVVQAQFDLQTTALYTWYTFQVQQITKNGILSKQVGPAEVLLTSALVKLRALLKRRNHVFGILPYKPTWHNSGKPDVSSNIANEM